MSGAVVRWLLASVTAWLVACSSPPAGTTPAPGAGVTPGRACSPGESRPCDLDAQGKTVLWPRLGDLGEPLGACQRGLQRCDDAGQWGACGGLIPPSVELCDGLDNDCDGLFDNDAVDAPLWRPDRDGDGFADASTAPVARCENPGESLFFCQGSNEPCPESWRPAPGLLDGDCNDLDATTYPGAWDGPAIPSRPSGLVPPGLQVEFFNIAPFPAVPDLSVLAPIPGKNRTDVAIDYALVLGAMGPGLPVDVAARWTGEIVVDTTDVYDFHTLSDDGVRLWVNNQLLIDDWGSHADQENVAMIGLTKGVKVPIKLEWFDHAGGGTIALRWSSTGMPRQTLTVQLAPTPEQTANRCGGSDNDCDGLPNNGVFRDESTGVELSCAQECDPLSVSAATFLSRPCNVPPSQLGPCHAGAQLCRPNGTWSACAGDVQASPRDCTSSDDNNCDGDPDDQIEGGCSCAPVGKIETFEAHPQDGVGVCHAGVRECVQKGGEQVWQVTVEPVGPTPERCQVQKDHDCNGRNGDAACRATLWTSARDFSQQGGCSFLPEEAYPSLTPDSHGDWAALAVWTNPEDTTGMAPVFRCICPSRGYSTTSIDLACDSPQVGCIGPEDTSELVAHVSRENMGGYNPVKYVELASGATGYCYGDESGCIFSLVCIGPDISAYWTFLPPRPSPWLVASCGVKAVPPSPDRRMPPRIHPRSLAGAERPPHAALFCDLRPSGGVACVVHQGPIQSCRTRR